MVKDYVLKEDEIHNLVKDLPMQGVILLRGNLATGKTTLVKEIVKFLNLPCIVTSPTFSILNEYSNLVFHYDIYNCELEGFLAQGLLENLTKEGLHLVEWGEDNLAVLLDSLGIEYLIIDIKSHKDKRIYQVRKNA